MTRCCDSVDMPNLISFTTVHNSSRTFFCPYHIDVASVLSANVSRLDMPSLTTVYLPNAFSIKVDVKMNSDFPYPL